jgi:ABC transport system ATP-binding/permease protein
MEISQWPGGRKQITVSGPRPRAGTLGPARNFVAALALLPIILGAVIRAVPAPQGLTGTSNGNAIQGLLILILAACPTGVANAVRELVKERTIYGRERAAGLSAGAVLSGAVLRLNGKIILEQLSWLWPSRDGLGATAATVNLNRVTPPPPGSAPDPLGQHTPHVWLLDMGLQLVLVAVFIALTWWRLLQLNPGRRR